MIDCLKEPLKIGRWYRVNGCAYYCVGFTEVRWENRNIVHMECIQPQHYAAYVTHHIISENKPPHRTIAEMLNIPKPKTIRVSFLSTENIEKISSKEALSAQSED